MTQDNQPASNRTVRVNDLTQDYVVNMTNLTDKVIYHVFLATENDWPKYNLLMKDPQVARIEAKTIKKRSNSWLKQYSLKLTFV